MLSQFRDVWKFLGDVISSIPSDVSTIVIFVFIGVGIIGILRSI